MTKPNTWDIIFYLLSIGASLALTYFKVCLFTKCKESHLVFQPLVFVLGFAILTKTWRLVPRQLACHCWAYRLYDVSCLFCCKILCKLH